MATVLGRPTEKTPEVVAKIEEAAALGASVEEMAFYAGVHRTTLYRWMEADEDFRDRIHDLQQKPILLARQTIVRGLATSPDDAKWYLERKLKKEFSSRQELTGADGKDINPLSVEEMAKLDKLLEYGNESAKQPEPASEPKPVEPAAPTEGGSEQDPAVDAPAVGAEPTGTPAGDSGNTPAEEVPVR